MRDAPTSNLTIMDYGDTQATRSNPKPGPSKQKRVKFVLDPTNQDSSDTTLSSSSSSSDDFFQVDPQTLPKNGPQDKPPHHPARPAKPFEENNENDLSNEGSPGSTFQFSDITPESMIPIQASPTQSPSAQVMQRPIGFDLDRIPPSVFSKSSTPTEWSVNSNDSLFSIRIGETSFSRDHVCRVIPELTENGELLQPSRKSGESTVFGSNSPKCKDIEPYLDIEKTIGEDVKSEGAMLVEESKRNGPKGLVSNGVKTVKRDPRGGLYGPLQVVEKSQVRENSVKPIKKKSSSCGMCCCGGCHLACCGCKWLSCSFCCSFKWCFGCLKWPKCRLKCPSLSSCCCNCSCLSCCNCSSWSCFKCSSWSCCNGFSWSCFKCSSGSCCSCSSLSCFKCSSWSCFNCSSWSCCKCSSWPCFKCSSWSCFNCSSWSCCKCHCLNCTWACCYCRKRKRKTSSCDSPAVSSDTTSKSSTKTTSRSKCSCFSCSCCWCWSCSCCC